MHKSYASRNKFALDEARFIDPSPKRVVQRHLQTAVVLSRGGVVRATVSIVLVVEGSFCYSALCADLVLFFINISHSALPTEMCP